MGLHDAGRVNRAARAGRDPFVWPVTDHAGSRPLSCQAGGDAWTRGKSLCQSRGLVIATLALLVTLGAAPAGPVKIAAPLLEGVNLSDELTAFYSDHLAQQLASHGLKVTNPRDVGQVLGLERQRELLGV